MSEQPTDTDVQPTDVQPTDTPPTGNTAYAYDVTDDDHGNVLASFTYAPEKVSDVEAVRLVRGNPLPDSIVVRAAGHPILAFDVDRQTGPLHLDRYEVDPDDGEPFGEAVSHPIRTV